MKKILERSYADVVSLENLLEAWEEFSVGKCARKDAQAFELRLMEHLISLHTELITKSYRHGTYEAFKVNDPKPRDIHKASVRDRIVHRALYRVLSPFFDTLFIADSYSCRTDKGTHRALRRFEVFARKVSRNQTKTAWVLKGDIRKFFASIDHGILLLDILRERIVDEDILWLLGEVVGSFHASCHPAPDAGSRISGSRLGGRDDRKGGCDALRNSGLPHPRGLGLAMTEKKSVTKKGLPLGNLTSQLFANVYLNEFDQFVKHGLKAPGYIRYADDFVILSREKEWLESILFRIEGFLHERLKLELHPDKLFLKTLASGMDFLGWVHFPDHRVLRTVTKRRMFRKLDEKNISSYLGLLGHGNGYILKEMVSGKTADSMVSCHPGLPPERTRSVRAGDPGSRDPETSSG